MWEWPHDSNFRVSEAVASHTQRAFAAETAAPQQAGRTGFAREIRTLTGYGPMRSTGKAGWKDCNVVRPSRLHDGRQGRNNG
jgi:hypothetical protein